MRNLKPLIHPANRILPFAHDNSIVRTDGPALAARHNPTEGAGGFDFTPELWVDRETHREMRARAEPMFCYAQAMESVACLVENGNRLEKIGVQAFAG